MAMLAEIIAPPGVALVAPAIERADEVLSPPALAFLADLHRSFERERLALLAERRARKRRFDMGELPDFPYATKAVRAGTWRIAQIPKDLQDRRVELTGPVDQAGLTSALRSGAKVFMADFEDAHTPSWANTMAGQLALMDHWARGPARGGAPLATLILRPRGLHLVEEHVLVDDTPISGALFDFGLYLFHSHAAMHAAGTAPYVYLPKLEGYAEARFWNAVFVRAQRLLHLPQGTIRASVLIETLPAGFEMDEILYELKDHVTALACGRWDYLFSFIKKFSKNPNYLMPDRGRIDFSRGFLRALSLALIKTCHRRGAYAIMGGMASALPILDDAKARDGQIAEVRAEKEREARDGFDGSWVSHSSLIRPTLDVFDELVPAGNQLNRLREDVAVSQSDLLEIGPPVVTEAGLRQNIRVGVRYIEAWLRGVGSVPLYGLVENASTAEVSRAQIWQQLQLEAKLDDGRTLTLALFLDCLRDEMRRIRAELGPAVYDAGRFPEAIRLFRELTMANELEEFLTVPAARLLDRV